MEPNPESKKYLKRKSRLQINPEELQGNGSSGNKIQMNENLKKNSLKWSRNPKINPKVIGVERQP